MSRINWANIDIDPKLRDALKVEFDSVYSENENLRRKVTDSPAKKFQILSRVTIDELTVKNIVLDSEGSIKSRDYIDGLSGTGFCLEKDRADKTWDVSLDNIHVRVSAIFKELVSQVTTAINAKLFLSNSGRIKLKYPPPSS